MPPPVILCVSDDIGVLEDLQTELADALTPEYRFSTADSAADARGELRRIKRRGAEIALLVADAELQERSELVEETRELFPQARVALLCQARAAAVAEAEQAAAEDHDACDLRLTRPWSSGRNDVLYPLADLLDDWRGSLGDDDDPVRLIGHRWSRHTHQLREFLACNLVPYKSLDIESSSEARRIIARHGGDTAELPLVLLPDRTLLERPAERELAEAIGLQTEARRQFYDLVVIGGGPAGLAAAVYGASEGLRCAVLEQSAPGGQAGTSARIENYLGFPQGLTGADLTRRAVDQAKRFGAELVTSREVVGLRRKGRYRLAKLSDGDEVAGHALLLACGVEYRQLDVPGVERLSGAGIYYGAARTEADNCTDRRVYILGGGNSAAQAAVYLSEYARSVTLLVREPTLEEKMSHYLVERIETGGNIEVRLGMQIAEVEGEDHLEALLLEGVESGEQERVEAEALYLFIGAAPNTGWLADSGVLLDDDGYVLTGRDLLQGRKWPEEWMLRRVPKMLETSVPGVFAAGDVRSGSVKRVASAAGEGGMAIQLVHEYISEL